MTQDPTKSPAVSEREALIAVITRAYSEVPPSWADDPEKTWIEEAADAILARLAPAPEKSVWLIENRTCSPPQYATEITAGTGSFLCDPNKAWRFDSERAAQDAIRKSHMTAKEQLLCEATEHKWIDNVHVAPAPEKVVGEWPDIGVDPLKGERNGMAKAAEKRVQEAYVKQQPHVPDQTALVWRWDIGNLLSRLQVAEMRVDVYRREEDERAALAQPEAATGWEDEDRLADMAAFGASESACILYPGADQQAERTAYCKGAGDGVRAISRRQEDAQPETARVGGLREALSQALEQNIGVGTIDARVRDAVIANVLGAFDRAALATQPAAGSEG